MSEFFVNMLKILTSIREILIDIKYELRNLNNRFR